MPLLLLEDVVAGYGPLTVLNGASISLEVASRTALLGRNGVGKSTLIKTIMGLSALKGGRIVFDGEDIAGLSTAERAMRGLGYVPQTRDIFKSLTVEENLLAGTKRMPSSTLDTVYQLFPRLKQRRKNGGGQLSGGEQQMLSVARTLLGKPRLMLLDEPLEGLAPLIRLELLAAFKRIASDSGMAILVAEQQVHEVLTFAHDAVILEKGDVQYAGFASDLLSQPYVLERFLAMGVHPDPALPE